MTYRELYEKATKQLEKSEITLGEYEEMTNALDREIGTCKDCAIKQLDKSESAEVDAEKYYCPIVSRYVDETPNFYCSDFRQMTYGQIFYQAIKDKEYRIFHKPDKFITKIEDSEYTDRKEWDYLVDAESYIMKKMKENENKGWRE